MEAPLAIVDASLVLLSQLQAEDCLREATIVGVGTGSFSKDDAKQVTNDWIRTAYPDRQATRAHRATPEDLIAIGIGVREASRG